MALSKSGWGVLYEDDALNTRWRWFQDLSAAEAFALGAQKLGRPFPLLFRAQEVR